MALSEAVKGSETSMQPASVLVRSISGLAKACRSDQHIVGRRSTAHGSQREVRVASNQPTNNPAVRLVDCLPQQGSDWSIAPK
jgi:hypothetical protein